MQSTGTKTPFSWKAEKYTSRVSQHSRVEFDSGLTYTSHVKKVAKDAAWKLSCIRRVAHLLDAQGVGNTLQVTSPLPDGILAPRMVLLPPSYLASLTGFKPEPSGWPG
ncbi:hypothetical protein GWK47_033522 [Chionoecetes opilio]|uniref:Uncharacterized protein n=1 Tax=Chionoecetes opilio TaxID=41210 RepID=A0A8J4YJP8_CHIOP|nr:hypothetical protein GWK47_033522 [Chionoecetes opilio]